MGFLNNLDIAVSGMSAQRLRLDIIAQNVQNATTTRTSDGTPYRRQVVVFSEDDGYKNLGIREFIDRKARNLPAAKTGFGSVLEMTLAQRRERGTHGVVVTEIWEDPTPFTPVYDPSHPDADEDGYYYLPNVDVEEEQLDALLATNSYTANLTIFNSLKSMAQQALTIGRG